MPSIGKEAMEHGFHALSLERAVSRYFIESAHRRHTAHSENRSAGTYTII